MPDDSRPVDVSSWVERAAQDPVAYRERQAAEIVLNAIADSVLLKSKLFLKGGMLLGLAYGSPRQTTDIDFSTTLSVDNDIEELILSSLNNTFPRTAASLGYANIIVRVQTVKYRPRKQTFLQDMSPAIKLKIAYAVRNRTNEFKRLKEGRSSNVINVDISFKEPLEHIQFLQLNDGKELLSYGLIDLVAEKYRALLQQKTRERDRRQDVYDLYILIRDGHLEGILLQELLETLFVKCRARDLEPERQSLDDSEIRSRAAKNWGTLKLELETVPDFEECFRRIADFYRSLPWGSISSESSD